MTTNRIPLDSASLWNGTTAALLTMEDVRERFGDEHIAWIKAQPNPAGTAESRAIGYWRANEPELYAWYKALARLLATDALASLPSPV